MCPMFLCVSKKYVFNKMFKKVFYKNFVQKLGNSVIKVTASVV